MTRQEFDRFVSESGKDILRFCRMNAGGSAEGDDLYQDTWLQVVKNISRYDTSRDFEYPRRGYPLQLCIIRFHPYMEKQKEKICMEAQDRSV